MLLNIHMFIKAMKFIFVLSFEIVKDLVYLDCNSYEIYWKALF